MHDDNLPVGPAGDDERLPARADASANAALTTQRRTGALSVEMLADEHRDDDDVVDLREYWRILVKRRRLVLGVLAGLMALTLLLTLMATPIYRATAVVQIDNQQQQVVQEGNMGVQGPNWDPQFMQTQYELMGGYELAERVADQLNLDGAALDQLNRPGWLDRVKGLVRPDAKPVAALDSADPIAMLDAATGVVRDGLTIEPVRNSRLVRIHYDSPVPAFAARVANATAEGFIASGLERRIGASSYAKTYLEDQIKLVKSRLEDSERELVAFAQKENLISNADGQSLAGQNLSELNTALATAQEQRIRAQARWSQAQAARGAALPASMLSDSILRQLQQQRSTLQGQYQQKLQVLLPEYPEMLQIKGQMDDLDKQVADELRNIRASIKAEYDAAATQENLLKGQLSSLGAKVLDVDGRSIQYTILKREVDTNRQFYDGLLQRYKEVGVAGDVRVNNIAVVEQARLPSGRHKPNVALNLAIGLVLGLMLGVLLAFLLEFLDDTIKTPEDIEQRLKLPVLGIIPKLFKQTPAEAVLDPRSGFSEAYRSVRTALQFSTGQGVPKVLLITSAGPGEGKSTTALTLARNFAKLGKRVLLVEGDLRNPSLGKVMGISAEVGLSNLLAGASTLGEAVLGTDAERLDVMLSGPLPPSPTELLSGSKLVSLLSVSSQHYDHIIIDGPPVMGLADAPILANAADGTLLVVHSGKTRVAAGQSAVKRLTAARAALVGSLLTQYDTKVAGYSYSYEGYYAYGNAPQLAKR